MTKKELLIENSKLKADISALKQRYEKLLKLIFGAKSERFVPDEVPEQLSLFTGAEDSKKEQIEEETEVISYERKKKGKKHPGRNEIPDHLPVEEIIIEPEEDTTGMKRIGEEITETLKYTPASLIKIRTIRPKYAKPNEEGVVIGKLPSRPIPKSYAEASLLAHIFISKFIDHLPFYRIRQMFKRDSDWDLPSSTINDWFISVCTLLEPLYQVLIKKILKTNYIQADESTIRVLDKSKKNGTHLGYQWVYHSPKLGYVYFHYRKGRGQSGPKELLEDYDGYLQTDGYKVYDKIARGKPIILVGCMAHLRRKFYESLSVDKARATYALNLIQQLYAIERKMKEDHLSAEARNEIRQTKSKALMNKFKEWMDTEYPKVLPKSLIGEAIKYGLRQWDKLIVFTTDQKLHIDNNLTENSIRPLALGRKNYLFAGSHKGAERIAMMYSFFATCKKQNVNPRNWLQQTLEKIPDYPIKKIEELLPRNEGG